jgi:hypothetical protein
MLGRGWGEPRDLFEAISNLLTAEAKESDEQRWCSDRRYQT